MLSWNNILFCSHYRPFPLLEFCLNLSGFPHAQYVQPYTGHTQSHPTAICTDTHLNDGKRHSALFHRVLI